MMISMPVLGLNMRKKPKSEILLLAGLVAFLASGAATPGMAAFKKWRISKSDESRYCSAFVAFNRSIFTEICRKSSSGGFVDPSFENVAVPAALRERFAESALKRYFNRVDRDRVRGWMKGLTADGNWTWNTTVRKNLKYSHRSELEGVPFVSVVIKNGAPLGLRGVTLHVPKLKRSYTMVSGMPVTPKKSGTFTLQLSEKEYKQIASGRYAASIRRLWW